MNLPDILSIIFLAAGITACIIGIKKQKKSLKYLALVFIVLFLVVAVPDFMNGFVNGMIAPE